MGALADGAWTTAASAFARDVVFAAPLGAVFVGPFALLSGGVAGWLVGRLTGTAAPPAR